MRRLKIVALLALDRCRGAGKRRLRQRGADAKSSSANTRSTATRFPAGSNPDQIAVNHATGQHPRQRAQGRSTSSTPNGSPVDFAALGSPTLPTVKGRRIAVDNTWRSDAGEHLRHTGYGNLGSEVFWSYAPDGSPIGGKHSQRGRTDNGSQALAVMPDGTLQAIGRDGPFCSSDRSTVRSDRTANGAQRASSYLTTRTFLR